MQAEIITIGDEILIGQIIDTNSAWLGQRLSQLGVRVNKITSLSDKSNEIELGLNLAIKENDIVVITGGLGPTKDDVTKHTLAKFFETELVLNQEVLQDVIDLFNTFGKSITELNRAQAYVPANCIVLRNKKGTAPGMAWYYNGKLIISLPGVPYEMKNLFDTEVEPLIRSKFTLPAIEHLTILTQGIGESALANKIADWENSLPENVKLAYLPSPGQVRLRLSAFGNDVEQLKNLNRQLANSLIPLLDNYFYGFNNDTLEGVIARLFFANKKTLAVAESCTGGAISHKITRVPGCSAFFKGGFITYDNQLKINLLGVNPETIDVFGVVSSEVVTQMLEGLRKFLKVDYGVAVSGIAGPDGGTLEKPVGTVWIGVFGPDYQEVKKFQFGNDRELNIERTALTALNLLRLTLTC